MNDNRLGGLKCPARAPTHSMKERDKMSEHTAGPWRWFADGDGNPDWHIQQETNPFRCVAINIPTEQDARLIAAAPELLEALMWCSGSGDFAPGGRAHKGWLKLGRPAIEKALDSAPITPKDKRG